MLTFSELLWVRFQCAWLRSELELVERKIAEMDHTLAPPR